MGNFLLRLFFLGFAASMAFSQATLVKDINIKPVPNDGSSPLAWTGGKPVFAKLGPFYYFSARTVQNGIELWCTNGVASRTALVKDINPGYGDSYPDNFCVMGGKLFFTADDGTNGNELWVTDGTTAGTKMVKDIFTGEFGSSPKFLTACGFKLFFAASCMDKSTPPKSLGKELWISDGTSKGTKMVADILGGPKSSSPRYITALGSKVIFQAFDGFMGQRHGYELWESDGTCGGTKLLKDINSGSYSSIPSNLIFYNSKIYFRANDGISGIELWVTDGTTAGTRLVKDMCPGANDSYPNCFAVAAGRLYFSAGDGKSGLEPWVSDGTTLGTKLVKDIRKGYIGSGPSHFAALGKKVLFQACDGTRGFELWITDGTTAGTTLLKDIYPGTNYNSSFPDCFCATGGVAFFRAENSAVNTGTGSELWKTDGTTAGTILVKDINPRKKNYGYPYSGRPDYLTAVAPGKTIFSANDGTNGVELWISDGTAKGTTILKDINTPPPGYSRDSYPANIIDAYGTAWFSADDGINGCELWKSDGTSAGTVMVKDIFPGFTSGRPNSSSPRDFTLLGGNLFFTGFVGGVNGTGRELYKVDLATGLVTLVKDIYVGASSSSPAFFATMGKELYFSASNGYSTTANGLELWKSDGTAAGTTMVKDIVPGSSSSYPSLLTFFKGKIYFKASDNTIGAGHGAELWVSDGTAAGTFLFKDIRSPGSSLPADFTVAGDNLFFTANDGTYGIELWKSDGTALGTIMVKDIRPGAYGSALSCITPVGDQVFFKANDGYSVLGHGYELWKSDGTAAGTVLVKDIRPGSAGSYPFNLVALGGKLFFSAQNGTNGAEPWISDGTAKGTFMLKDIYPGLTSSQVLNATAVGSRCVFFSAFDRAHGCELWKTDGTKVGTVRVTDINPGQPSSLPSFFTLSGGRLFFKANDGIHGYEPFVLFPGASSQSFGIGYASGAPANLSATDPVLGGNLKLTVKGLVAGQACLAFLDTPKSPPFLPLPGYIYLSLKFITNIPIGVDLPVPNVPAITGFSLALQGFTIPGNTPLGAGFTNGVYITFGP